MAGNGYSSDVDEVRTQHLIMGAGSAVIAVTALDRACDALHEAGRVIESLSKGLSKIQSDTARAVSDTVELKRHLKAITDREQELRRELDVVKATMVRKRIKPKKKKRRGK